MIRESTPSPASYDTDPLDDQFKVDIKRLARRGAPIVALFGAVAAFNALNAEEAPSDQSSYTLHTVEKNQGAGDIVLEVCPTASDSYIMNGQKDIGMLNNSTNPANPTFAEGQTIKVPTELYCDTDVESSSITELKYPDN